MRHAKDNLGLNLVGISKISTSKLGKQVNIHCLSGHIHFLGSSIQDISLAYRFAR